MQVYDDEKGLGLETESCVAHATVQFDTSADFSKADTLFTDDVKKDISSRLTPDICSVHGILVSTNWNRNDDVFVPEQVWAAKDTPLFKPANMGHQGKEIDKSNETIGVIYSSTPVDDDYNPISSNDGNEKFHLLVGMYLWAKYWPTYVNEIKKGIENNTMYISMECTFPDFGYALREPNSDSINLISRTDQTSWLTKYLRAYKGPGKVTIENKDYIIGRWLKKITFTGVGFVIKPGNPESILFKDFIMSANANLQLVDDSELLKVLINKKFDVLNKNCVLDLHKGTLSLWPTH